LQSEPFKRGAAAEKRREVNGEMPETKRAGKCTKKIQSAEFNCGGDQKYLKSSNPGEGGAGGAHWRNRLIERWEDLK